MRNETDSIPDIFIDVLTPASRIPNYNTRFVNKLNCFWLRGSTNLGNMFCKFSAPKIWETVPLGLKCLPYHKFKKEWKSYLLINHSIKSDLNLSYMFYNWYYLRLFFLSLLPLPIIRTWRCLRRSILLLWTLYTNEVNVFWFNDYLSATLFSYLRTLVSMPYIVWNK